MSETKHETKLNALLLEYRNLHSSTFIQHIPLHSITVWRVQTRKCASAH